MIYTPNDDESKPVGFFDCWGLRAALNWLKSIGNDAAQIHYVAFLDWKTEHLPESVLPFLPEEIMTTEQATAFFDDFTAEIRGELSDNLKMSIDRMIERRMQYGEDRPTAAANIAKLFRERADDIRRHSAASNRR